MFKQIFITILSSFIITGCSGTKPELGIKDGRLLSCPDSPNCVNSQAVDEEHSIHPITFNGDLRQAQQRLTTVLKAEARCIIVDIEDRYLRAEFKSAVFGFTDDVEFLLSENDAITIIDVRSASRLGYSDFGVNRKRIENIRQLMSQ